jgi:hypothetical protein
VLGHGRLGEVGQIYRAVSLLDREPAVAGQVIDSSRHPADRPASSVDVPRCSRAVPGLDCGQLEIRAHDGKWGTQLVNHLLRPAATLDICGLDLRPGVRHNPFDPTGHDPGDYERRDQGQSRRQQTGVDQSVERPFLGHDHNRQVVTDLGNSGSGVSPRLVTHQERNGHHHDHKRHEQGWRHQEDRQSNPGPPHALAFKM